MAKIVLGLGTSHSPQLSAPPEAWPEFGKNDKSNQELLGRDGKFHPYDEFLAQADPSLGKQLNPSVWQAKWDLSAIPAVFVFDQDSKRVAKFTDDDADKPFNYDDVEKFVRKLLYPGT